MQVCSWLLQLKYVADAIIFEAIAIAFVADAVVFVAVAGEVLGCTAPVIAQAADAIVFVADGRFHLEAIMIANPDIPAYRCLSCT